jgi:hypothetical protein
MNHGLFDDSGSNAKIILHLIIWEDDCIKWTGKDWLFQVTILASAYNKCRKPWTISVRTVGAKPKFKPDTLRIQATIVIMSADLLGPTSESLHLFVSAEQPTAFCPYGPIIVFYAVCVLVHYAFSNWIFNIKYLHI